MILIIIETLLIGVIGHLIGVFYNYSLRYGSIFGKLGNILNSWANLYDHILDKNYKPLLLDRFKAWIANPLGECPYCSTTWITIILLILYWSSWEVLPKTQLIIISSSAALGIQHILLRLFRKDFKL